MVLQMMTLDKFSPVDPRGPLHFAVITELKLDRKAIGKPLCSPQKRNSELITVTYTHDKHSSVGLDSSNVCLCLVITQVSRPLARTLPVWCELGRHQPYTSTSLVQTLGNTSLVNFFILDTTPGTYLYQPKIHLGPNARIRLV